MNDEKKDSDTEKKCPLSLNDWVMFLNNEINNLESGKYQILNIFLVIVVLAATVESALITWLFSTVSIANPPQNAVFNISPNAILYSIWIVFISYILFIFYWSYKTPKTKKIAHGLENIIKRIIRGDLDTNEVRKEWEMVMQSSDKDIINKDRRSFEFALFFALSVILFNRFVGFAEYWLEYPLGKFWSSLIVSLFIFLPWIIFMVYMGKKYT